MGVFFINKVIKILRSHKNREGFSLPEVMIAVAILGGIALVMMQMTKEQTKQQVQSRIDADLAQAKQEIASLMANPAHCNANFYNKTGTSSPVAIYTCSTTNAASCRGGGGVLVSKFPKLTGATWTGGGVSDHHRVRVSNITLTIADLNPAPPATLVITTASLQVQFQTKNLTTTRFEKPITFSTPVVYNGSIVVGCPKTWNSTVLF